MDVVLVFMILNGQGGCNKQMDELVGCAPTVEPTEMVKILTNANWIEE